MRGIKVSLLRTYSFKILATVHLFKKRLGHKPALAYVLHNLHYPIPTRSNKTVFYTSPVLYTSFRNICTGIALWKTTTMLPNAKNAQPSQYYHLYVLAGLSLVRPDKGNHQKANKILVIPWKKWITKLLFLSNFVYDKISK